MPALLPNSCVIPGELLLWASVSPSKNEGNDDNLNLIRLLWESACCIHRAQKQCSLVVEMCCTCIIGLTSTTWFLNPILLPNYYNCAKRNCEFYILRVENWRWSNLIFIFYREKIGKFLIKIQEKIKPKLKISYFQNVRNETFLPTFRGGGGGRNCEK